MFTELSTLVEYPHAWNNGQPPGVRGLLPFQGCRRQMVGHNNHIRIYLLMQIKPAHPSLVTENYSMSLERSPSTRQPTSDRVKM